MTVAERTLCLTVDQRGGSCNYTLPICTTYYTLAITNTSHGSGERSRSLEHTSPCTSSFFRSRPYRRTQSTMCSRVGVIFVLPLPRHPSNEDRVGVRCIRLWIHGCSRRSHMRVSRRLVPGSYWGSVPRRACLFRSLQECDDMLRTFVAASE